MHSMYCYYATIEPHQHPRHYLFYFQFSYNIFLTLLIHSFFLIFTLSQTFLPLLPFHLPTTLYLNFTLTLSLYLPLFCLFLFSLSYYKFVIFYSILCIVSSHKKGSLSLNFLVDFVLLISEPL